MKIIMGFLALLLLTANSYALKLEGINGIEILAINGEKVKSSFFSLKDEYEVPPGYHQVVIWYLKEFDDESAQTAPVIFNLDLQEDTQISVPDYNQLYKAERAIKKGLTFDIISKSKRYNLTNLPRLTSKGFSVFSDVKALIQTYNKDHNITIAGTKPATPPPPTVVGTPHTDADSIQAQITLYQQSTPAQKKAFRLWLLEQDVK